MFSSFFPTCTFKRRIALNVAHVSPRPSAQPDNLPHALLIVCVHRGHARRLTNISCAGISCAGAIPCEAGRPVPREPWVRHRHVRRTAGGSMPSPAHAGAPRRRQFVSGTDAPACLEPLASVVASGRQRGGRITPAAAIIGGGMGNGQRRNGGRASPMRLFFDFHADATRADSPM